MKVPGQYLGKVTKM